MFLSAINAPTTGSETFEAYLATAKALGSNAPNVGRSLVPQASVVLTIPWGDFQESYTGAVAGGGVDAVVVATPPY